MSKVREVNEANFKSEVLMKGGRTLIDFWAPWCGPCKALAPKLDEIADADTGAQIVKANIEDCPDLTQTYGVRGVPTLILLEDGEEIGRLSGNQTKDAILALINSR